MCLNVPVGGGEEGPGVVEDESEFEFAERGRSALS